MAFSPARDPYTAAVRASVYTWADKGWAVKRALRSHVMCDAE